MILSNIGDCLKKHLCNLFLYVNGIWFQYSEVTLFSQPKMV